MNILQFRALLLGASYEALRFGSQYVTQALPWQFKFNVWLNQSNEDDPEPGFVRFPDDDGLSNLLESDQEVSELLCRAGNVPVWIDIALFKVAPTFTILSLKCAGRFTDDPSRFYYEHTGFGPFGIKSPLLPPGWEEGVRFDLAAA